jgi:hypothetical protein
MTAMEKLQQGEKPRLMTVAVGFLAFFFITTAIGYVGYSNLFRPQGYDISHDFIYVWGAAKTTLESHPADAYDLSYLNHRLGFSQDNPYGWFYPPPYALLALPFGLMPLIPAFFSFMIASVAAYTVALRQILPQREALWGLAAFSGMWINLAFGQNAFLTATLAGSALLCLRNHAVLAGILLGFLSIKPHLALLFPLALIAARCWSALLTAAGVACALFGASYVILGESTFTAWEHIAPQVRHLLEYGGPAYWNNTVTPFAWMRLMGAPVWAAYTLQALFAVTAAAVVWRVWRRSYPASLRSAILMTCTFLFTPYASTYDLAWLAFPIAWHMRIGLTQGWLRYERVCLLIVSLTPALQTFHLIPVPIAPGALLVLVVMQLKRCEK